jgi:hypothetical protein
MIACGRNNIDYGNSGGGLVLFFKRHYKSDGHERVSYSHVSTPELRTFVERFFEEICFFNDIDIPKDGVTIKHAGRFLGHLRGKAAARSEKHVNNWSDKKMLKMSRKKQRTWLRKGIVEFLENNEVENLVLWEFECTGCEYTHLALAGTKRGRCCGSVSCPNRDGEAHHYPSAVSGRDARSTSCKYWEDAKRLGRAELIWVLDKLNVTQDS